MRQQARVFSVDGQDPLILYRHQAQAIAKADHGTELRRHDREPARASRSASSFRSSTRRSAPAPRAKPPRTRAIVIYPMNALANSQLKEIDKFIKQSGLPDRLRPTFARYTGQEEPEERERIREAKPDILLTNFMMLELLMTRQNELDRAVIGNCPGPGFPGARRAAHLSRPARCRRRHAGSPRARPALPRSQPICIGTSATMASEGDDAQRATVVAAVPPACSGRRFRPMRSSARALSGQPTRRSNRRSLVRQLAAVNDELPSQIGRRGVASPSTRCLVRARDRFGGRPAAVATRARRRLPMLPNVWLIRPDVMKRAAAHSCKHS